METKIIEIRPDEVKLPKTAALLTKAGEILYEGGLVAFPTETVYGLGANAFDAEASAKIYAAKGRPSDNPLIVHIADKEALDRLVTVIPDKARLLMDAFWPGPLTMIFHKSPEVPLETTGGLFTVAVRMPSNEIARSLIRNSGGYVAAPSANRSGSPSPTRAEHVLEDLNGMVDLIIDGGESVLGLESTIIDLTTEEPAVLRPGFITVEMLEEVIGPVRGQDQYIDEHDQVVPKAPGMKYKHYAPNAELTLFEGEPTQVAGEIRERALREKEEGTEVGVITSDELMSYYADSGLIVKSIGSRLEPESVAKNLYRVLREFNGTDVAKIYSESFESNGIGQAIMNRLIRAAGHRLIHLETSRDFREIRRIVVVSNSDVVRGPVAAALLRAGLSGDMEVESRGLVAPFPEPINPKIAELAKKRGGLLVDHTAAQFSKADISAETLLFTMDLTAKIRVLKNYEGAGCIYTFGEFLGEDELEIPSPHGGEADTYEDCYQILEDTMDRVVQKWNLLIDSTDKEEQE